MDEHADERTAKSTFGRDRVDLDRRRRRPPGLPWAWALLVVLVCGLVAWGVWAAVT